MYNKVRSLILRHEYGVTPDAIAMGRTNDTSILPQNRQVPDKNGLNKASLPLPTTGRNCSHRRRNITLAISLLVLLAVHLRNFYTWTWQVPQRHACTEKEGSDEIEHGKLGAVASESSLCSGLGADILKIGGNAADAVSAPYVHSFGPNKRANSVLLDGRNGVLCRSYRCVVPRTYNRMEVTVRLIAIRDVPQRHWRGWVHAYPVA